MTNYFCILVKEWDGSSRYDWYVLDESVPSFEIVSDMSSQQHLPRAFASVIFDSKLLVLGGQLEDNLINQVQFFNCQTRKWEHWKSMIAARASPLAIPLKDRLYVFGSGFDWEGGNDDPLICGRPWAEYYSSELGAWLPLPDPPAQIMNSRYLSGNVVSARGSHLLLWNQCFFCVFDVDQGKWLDFIESPNYYFPHDIVMFSTRVPVINQTMYWYFGDIFAYDLGQNKCFDYPAYSFEPTSSSRPPLPDITYDCNSTYLFPTSKKEFCLVWYDRLDLITGDGYQKINVYCIKFRVKRHNDGITTPLLDLVWKSGPLGSTVSGNCIYQFANMQWEDTDKGRRGLNGHGPEIPNPTDLLNNLSRAMYEQSFYRYWRSEFEWERPHVHIPHVPKVKLVEVSLEDFLWKYGLGEYIGMFVDKGVTMNDLKKMTVKQMNALGIKMGPRKKLLEGVRLEMREEKSRICVINWK